MKEYGKCPRISPGRKTPAEVLKELQETPENRRDK
jgi:hypothetical protein